MKTSAYNWIFKYGKNTILYNGITGAMAIIDEQNVDIVKRIVESEKSEKYIGSLDNVLISELKHGGYIVDDDYDELQYLNILYNISKYNQKVAPITVVITQQCNLACKYCYQSKSYNNSIMSKNTIDSIVNYVESQAKMGVKSTLTLYGGEPLLYPDICLEICERSKCIHEEYGMKFLSKIVTNGTLLSSQIAKDLADVNVVQAQVTIDGNPETHNSQRPYKNGKKSYERILKNIIAANEYINIRIRVNIDRTNSVTCCDIEQLNSIADNVEVYIAPIRYDHEGKNSEYCQNQKYMIRKYGYKYRNPPLKPKIGGCIATKYNGIVVDVDGSIYDCWHEIGDINKSKYNINDIKGIKRDSIKRKMKWEEFNPYSKVPCSECKMLPTCGGGCPDDFITFGKPRCTFTEDTYIKYLKYNAECLMKNATVIDEYEE